MACNILQARYIHVIVTGTEDIPITMVAGGMLIRGGLTVDHIIMTTANTGPTFALRSGDTIPEFITVA